jgi:hypothetical protein
MAEQEPDEPVLVPEPLTQELDEAGEHSSWQRAVAEALRRAGGTDR